MLSKRPCVCNRSLRLIATDGEAKHLLFRRPCDIWRLRAVSTLLLSALRCHKARQHARGQNRRSLSALATAGQTTSPFYCTSTVLGRPAIIAILRNFVTCVLRRSTIVRSLNRTKRDDCQTDEQTPSRFRRTRFLFFQFIDQNRSAFRSALYSFVVYCRTNV